MKKVLITLTVLAATILGSFAQTATTNSSPVTTGGKFSIGLEGGLPTGDASDGFSAVIGASIKGELPVAANTYFTISAGYNSYLTKGLLKDMGAQSSFGFVPLKAGIKYYSEGHGFFLEGQGGIVYSTEKDGGNAYVYAPGIGYTFNSGLEAGVRFEGWTKDGGTTSQLGLRLAYRF